MFEVQNRIIANHKMLDTIRICQDRDVTVEILRDILGVSRATADKMIDNLLGLSHTPMLCGDVDETLPLISKVGRKVQIVHKACFFLGVSIGSTNTRVVLLGLDFKPVSREIVDRVFGFADKINKSCYKIDESESEYKRYSFLTLARKGKKKESEKDHYVFLEIQELVKCIIQPFLDSHGKEVDWGDGNLSVFHLMGIGFAVSGVVDYKKKSWLCSPRISNVSRLTVRDIMGSNAFLQAQANGVFLSLDNNAKAAMVSEYQYLMEREGAKDEKERNKGLGIGDVALLYLGTGIGMAAVIDRKLLRGSNNSSGEIGQMRLYDDKIHGNRTLEEILSDSNASLYLKYLPYVLNAIICIFGIERVILIGHSIAKYENLIPELIDQRVKFSVSSSQNLCEPELGRKDPNTSAIGAAIQAYFTMCNYRFGSENPENRTNLAYNISWEQAL